MSLSSTPADSTPKPLVLSSPDRVVFRAIPHSLASTNKKVTLSLRRSPAVKPSSIPAASSPTPTALDTLPAVDTPASPSEPATVPPNHQSPNSHRRSSSSTTTLTDFELQATTSAPSLCETSSSTLASAPNTNLSNNAQYPHHTSPRITITSPMRKQSTQPLLKNGLPIKSAMKSPLATPSPNSNHSSPMALCRPSSIRSHTSPSPISSPKFVHFNTQLEHVRLFLQGEMPSCVSERETIIDCRPDASLTSDVELALLNWSAVAPGSFQPGNIDAGASPLKVENVQLSEDQTALRGTVLIHNIAFHKHVSVRFTIDFWQTQTEVMAEYAESIAGTALDRFAFVIPLDMDKTAVEKTFCFAVRYQVIGREFWDSNNGMNYQLECKRVVTVASPATVSDLSKQMNSILLAARMPDYGKPVLKKKHDSRYDFSTSLSAAYGGGHSASSWNSTPASKTAYRPSEYISPVQSPPGYHQSLYASSPKFISPYLLAASPPDFHVGFEQLSIEHAVSPNKKNTMKSWGEYDLDAPVPVTPTRSQSYPSGFYGSSPKLSSSPISIPSGQAPSNRPAVGSSSYFDLVDRYCFYEPGQHSSPYTSPYSSYPNSPPAPCIRG
ncbi:hypothetical protein EMPS_06132 [Entomortierella parvispora]|uniref:CBM21 domain-containing protein n=1 Tax=Entomortierella parvispora TaxID=205924 RepID=A0A9P3HBQ4_9FUNG|nr:hypothetical protein EMPS_06132 [Entomortierella parvispora]